MKKGTKVYIVRSETFFPDAKLDVIESILNETIKDFVDDERIINIEVKERSGLMRFWIYLEEQTNAK